MSEIFIPLQELDPELHTSLREFIENDNEPMPERDRFIQTGVNNLFYGQKHTPEMIEEMSKRVMGKNNPMYGKHHSPETKQKLREASRGNISRLGAKHTPETKQKIRELAKLQNRDNKGRYIK